MSFFPSTGFCRSRRTSNTKGPTCGIGWCRGTRPTPEVLRASGKECAWEGETTACAKQARRQKEIRTIFEMEEPRSCITIWVCDNSTQYIRGLWNICNATRSVCLWELYAPIDEILRRKWCWSRALFSTCQQSHIIKRWFYMAYTFKGKHKYSWLYGRSQLMDVFTVLNPSAQL